VISPDHASRLGLTGTFANDDPAAAAQIIEQLRSLGFAQLRLQAAASGAAWFGSLSRALGEACEVLPVLAWEASQDAAFVSLVEAVSDRAGPASDAFEIALPGNRTENPVTIHAAGRAVQQRGKIAVLGMDAIGSETRLRSLDEQGVLTAFDVVLLDGSIESVAAAMPAARKFISKIWAAVHATSPNETANAQSFLDAAQLHAERIYWNGRLAKDDAPGIGLSDADGLPNLLGRLLANGLDGVARALANAAPTILSSRPILVTGGAGFIGANLVDMLAGEGHEILIYDALARPGVERNLHWLKQRHPSKIAVAIADLRDEPALTEAVRGAGAVFHLAAQVAVTTSLVRPLQDFDINVRGTLTILEALRRFNAAAPLLFASTNKVYGDLSDIALTRRGEHYLPDSPTLRAAGIDETRPLCFHTPYGCSKGAADQYVLDYAHSFGLRTAVLRMSCIYGERQLGTEDQGWLAHFLLRAIAGEKLTIYGDGRQVRDVLHIGDAIDTYLAAWRDIDRISGRAFNLGGGPANAISLLQLIDHIENLLGRPVAMDFQDWRAGDQRYFVADATAARSTLGLGTPLGWREGVARLAEHFGAMPHTAKPAQVREGAL
jgi:CDP-paratose 2-epimerase